MTACVTCPVLFPRSDPREPDYPMVCTPCRRWLLRRLEAIPGWCVDLTSTGLEPGGRDGVSVALPAGNVPGRSGAPRVSGSRERGVPQRLVLLGSADTRTVHDGHMVPAVRATGEKEWVEARFAGKDVRQLVRRREVVTDEHGRPVLVPAGDQVGDPSVAAVLRSWVVAWWEDGRGPRFGENLPQRRDVASSARWLADRLDWACDRLDSVGDFAAEVDAAAAALRRALGLVDAQPELCEGVRCRQCDLKTVFRVPGDVYLECDPQRKYGGCGALMTEDEYRQWTRLLAADAQRREGAA